MGLRKGWTREEKMNSGEIVGDEGKVQGGRDYFRVGRGKKEIL